jgi:enoyl-CoA hydratase/carnithine racemase
VTPERGEGLSLVLYDVVEHVATITYNRPDKLNAINGAMREQLNAAWQRFLADDDAWVAILTGCGRAFCVGADLADGNSAGTFPGSFWEMPTINSFESGLEVWKPTIAAVGGYCLGYGLTAVAACDFVIAAADAEFGMPEVLLGVPTIVGAIRLPRRINNMQHALELLLTGDRFDAPWALEVGLAGWVVPREELLTAANQLARRLCQGGPLAVRAVKEMAYRGQELPWIDAVRFGETMRRYVAQTDDAKEGMAARRDRREPHWRGR